MKILKLRFKNIHSFKGNHEIDFGLPPLSYSGLFAITGSTGAGKSTILDIITLALFNQIPRFEGKISNTEIEKLGSVMTHFTDEAFAEVEYMSNKGIYRSVWRVAKTRNNTLKDYEMLLINVKEDLPLDLKKSEIPKANEQIIGLNYDQFVRSIILSQGEFARFLKADKSERTSLLEEITGAKIFRTIGKAVFEKLKELKEEINQLKFKKEAIPVLSDDEVMEKTQHIEANSLRLSEMDHILSTSQSLLSLLEKKLALENRINQVRREIEQVSIIKGAFQTKDIKLKKHHALDSYRNDITLWQHLSKRVNDVKSEKEDCIGEISKQEKLLADAILEMKSFTGKDIHEGNFLSEMKNFEKYIIQLDSTLNQIKERGLNAKSTYSELLSHPNNLTYTKPLNEIRQINEQLDYCINMLDNLKLRVRLDETDETLRSNLKTLINKVVVEEKKSARAIEYEKTMTGIKSVKDKIIILHKDKEILLVQLQTSQKGIDAILTQLENLQKEKEEQFKVISLDEHRKSLKDNEPCPLCGSLSHPYCNDDLYIDLGKAEAKILSAQAQLNHLRQDVLKITGDLSAVNSGITTLENEILDKSKLIQEIEFEYPEFAIDENITLFQQTKILEMNQNIASIQAEMENRAALEFFTRCCDHLHVLGETTDEFNKISKIRLELYKGNDINGDADKIQNKYISSRDVSKVLKGTLQNLENNLQTSSTELKNKEEYLLKPLTKLGYSDILTAIQDILDDVALREISHERDSISNKETELHHTLKSLTKESEDIFIPENSETDLEALKNKITQLDLEKKNIIHINGGLTSDLESDRKAKVLIGEAEIILEEKNKSAEIWFLMDRLIGDSTGGKFARFAQNISLRHLIDLANRRLRKLTDRYQLVYTDIDADLMISDLYQGNIRRSVRTLSGGESFIVSLALALSLADMASQNVKLESLFIDEGFGTLDAETLETAIETLEKLQAENDRMIGIISHVDSLKERITTQIKVVKNNTGFAHIELVG